MAGAWTERIEKMQVQLKRSQDELKAAQVDLQMKIGNLEDLSFDENEQNEATRMSQQLDNERQTNSKLSGDLARSLELNLKLQFEIEEIRTKANQVIGEEKKHLQYQTEKNKALNHELELSQALCHEIRSELSKARDKFQADLSEKDAEISGMTETLTQFEGHATQQSDILKNLSSVAEKKIIELKMAFDKKTLEAQDYYSHLQQSLSQVSILRQENAALKDYISKLTALHQKA